MNKIIEEFRKKFGDYMGCAYEEIEDANLGEEVENFILQSLFQDRKNLCEKIELLPRHIYETNHFGTNNIMTKFIKLEDVLNIIKDEE